jgi:hypothetical protein
MPKARPESYEAALANPKFLARLDASIATKSYVDEHGCRVWTGRRTPGGYGRIKRGRRGELLVHRLVAIRAGRAKASDPETRHSCDNPACIEGEHLLGGTRADNALDRALRGRTPLGASGIRGVSHTGRNSKTPWAAFIGVNGKTFHLGLFPTAALAASFVIGARKHLGLETG